MAKFGDDGGRIRGLNLGAYFEFGTEEGLEARKEDDKSVPAHDLTVGVWTGVNCNIFDISYSFMDKHGLNVGKARREDDGRVFHDTGKAGLYVMEPDKAARYLVKTGQGFRSKKGEEEVVSAPFPDIRIDTPAPDVKRRPLKDPVQDRIQQTPS